MSNIKVFAKNKALEKSLGDFRPTFRYGEKLQMYNNIYKVLHFQDNGYTILEDEKNSKLAFPTNKLRSLMKKNLCQSLGAVNVVKSEEPKSDLTKATQLSGPSRKFGVTHASTNAAYAKQPKGATADPNQRGEPVGTVRPGKDGDNYKKISANPSVWVRISSGTVHHEAGGEEQDPMSVSHETRQQFHSMMSKVDSKVHPQDREKIHSKAQDWIKENAKFKHMQNAHNVNEVDSKGNKLPKTGIPSSTLNTVNAQGDKARKVRQELIDMIKDSHTKVKGGSDAK